MMDFLITQPGWLQNKADLDELHEVTLEWFSECSFLKDEIRFFQDLIDRNFLHMVSLTYLKETEKMVDELSTIRDKALPRITENLLKHERHLDRLLKHELSEDQYRQEHQEIAEGISKFMKNYKAFKANIFQLVERIKGERRRITA